MGSFRFLHCGDVHLGAGRQIHAERYKDLFRVFEEVTHAATDPTVQALLISGDSFLALVQGPISILLIVTESYPA